LNIQNIAIPTDSMNLHRYTHSITFLRINSARIKDSDSFSGDMKIKIERWKSVAAGKK